MISYGGVCEENSFRSIISIRSDENSEIDFNQDLIKLLFDQRSRGT